MSKCQSDCDNDSDCDIELICFQRTFGEPVPGCSINASYADNHDICVELNRTELSTKQDNLTFIGLRHGGPDDKPLGECVGKCDTDEDCSSGLMCFERTDDKPVPGCMGDGPGYISGMNYCVNATVNQHNLTDFGVNPTQILGKCAGDCDHDNECVSGLMCFQRDGYTAVENCGGTPEPGTDYCVNASADHTNLTFYGEDPSQTPLGKCAGDCDNDEECTGGLICFQRDDHTPVPGCKGAAVLRTDYCVELNRTELSTKQDNLTFIGLRGPEDQLLGECVGECDANNDCSSGLMCFERTDDEPVPGCGGTPETGINYCVNASADQHNLTGFGADPTQPLGKCVGDCDDDGECGAGLICFKRDGFTAVPGCAGAGVPGRDYCANLNATNLTSYGANPPHSLGKCAGDCDDDADCVGDLECFQRDGTDTVRGCHSGGLGDISNYDYCFDPNTASPTNSPTQAPTASPTVSPTTSPTNSPTQAPTASPTVSPTTSPTAAPTASQTEAPTPTQAPVSPTTSPTATPCFSVDTPVYILNGTVVHGVTAGDVKIGDTIVGNLRVSRVVEVKKWSGHYSACVVPQHFCTGHQNQGQILITENHAIRCASWPLNTWSFCAESWEHKTVNKLVHIKLQSYFTDSILTTNGVLLEPWDGANPGEICNARSTNCTAAHSWVLHTIQPLRFERYRIQSKPRHTRQTPQL